VLGAYQSARDVALEGGTNQVLRFLVGAALTYQLQRTHVFASGDVGLVGTLTRAQGAGYEPNQWGSLNDEFRRCRRPPRRPSSWAIQSMVECAGIAPGPRGEREGPVE
jgi:hypothetical protein